MVKTGKSKTIQKKIHSDHAGDLCQMKTLNVCMQNAPLSPCSGSNLRTTAAKKEIFSLPYHIALSLHFLSKLHQIAAVGSVRRALHIPSCCVLVCLVGGWQDVGLPGAVPSCSKHFRSWYFFSVFRHSLTTKLTGS